MGDRMIIRQVGTALYRQDPVMRNAPAAAARFASFLSGTHFPFFNPEAKDQTAVDKAQIKHSLSRLSVIEKNNASTITCVCGAEIRRVL